MREDVSKASDIAIALAGAASQMRVLRSLNWDAATRETFLKHKATKLPQVSYAPIDTQTARAAVQAVLPQIDKGSEIGEWLLRTAQTLLTTADLLDSRGTIEFYSHSSKLFGTADQKLLDGHTKVIQLARHIDKTLDELDSANLVMVGTDEALTAEQFAQALRPKLTKHFGDSAPNVELSETLSAKATAGSRRIRVRADADFTSMDVRQLLQHEALVHTATALNGRAQDKFPILGYAHMGTTQIQEGLAVFAEMIAGTMDPKRFRRLADRVIAIDMAARGADFIEVYHFFMSHIDDPEQAYENTRRVFRGGVMTGGAPFTKDLVYLNGLLRVHNFLRAAVSMNRADLIRVLFVGKMDLEDLPAIAHLIDELHIEEPKFMPYWAKDLRFVVSYLAYSSFLNQVKLPGLQDYYKDRLKAVPKVWNFDAPG